MERDFSGRCARPLRPAERKAMIARDAPLSILRQCALLGLSRSSLYYQAQPISEADRRLMRRMDELHLTHPFLGARRLARLLQREGVDVGRRHVGTLMGLMGIEAIYRKQRTSRPAKGHRIYPYLLREVVIERPNDLGATDVTYLPMAKGFAYLVAILDLYSRKVLAFRVSTTLATDFCIEALGEALRRTAPPRSSTPTRAANSPTKTSPRCWPPRECASAWTARDAGSTMCSSSGCGGA